MNGCGHENRDKYSRGTSVYFSQNIDGELCSCTTGLAGGYILGFRVDPQERLESVFQELHSLHQARQLAPALRIWPSLATGASARSG